jgi:hypothetical protein
VFCLKVLKISEKLMYDIRKKIRTLFSKFTIFLLLVIFANRCIKNKQKKYHTLQNVDNIKAMYLLCSRFGMFRSNDYNLLIN